MEIMTLVLFGLGMALLLGGAEALVRGAARLAAAGGISPLVIGLTVVAYSTSAPELAISVQSGWQSQTQLALGNVVGSNIFNILFILGISALITPLMVAQQLIRWDVPLLIGLSVLVLLLGLDGQIGRWDGLFLVAGAAGYTILAIYQARSESQAIKDEYADEFGARRPGSIMATFRQIGWIGLGLAGLVLGSRWLVDGAVELARLLGVSDLVIGLTILAAGTSLPEVATSIVAALRGERDIAVGNVIGSSIFNILWVLGLTGVVAPGGVEVPAAARNFDLPVMIAVALACLPIFFNGYKINRWEGALFLGYYVAYTVYLLLQAAAHALLPMFSLVMGLFVVPLTVITLAVVTVRAIRARRKANHVAFTA